jgi:hypothetical protein
VIDKRNIINFLFILSLPVYGVGTYIAAAFSPTIGFAFCYSPALAILLFYTIDLLYKRDFSFRLSAVYFLMLLFQLSAIVSLFIAMAKGLPETTLHLTISRAICIIAPFHAFIVVCLYNDNCRERLCRLTLWSLTGLLVINLVAYFGLGLTNALHSIDGRLNLPFFDGLYSGANILAITDLLILHYLLKAWKDPVKFVSLGAYFVFNFVLFYLINSRLSTLILFLVLLLLFFRGIRSSVVYFVSLLTIPILLSSGVLLYRILQQPIFVSLIQRVELEDVTTFNGRAYLWADAIDWLLHDQRGLLLGNGYKGHYFLDLVPDVVKLWNAEDSYQLHLHSTSLETLVCQGVVFYLVLCVLTFFVWRFYRRKHIEGAEEGAFFPVVIFLLFILQVDTFLYLDSMGFVIFALLMSQVVIRSPRAVTNETSAAAMPVPYDGFSTRDVVSV